MTPTFSFFFFFIKDRRSFSLLFLTIRSIIEIAKLLSRWPPGSFIFSSPPEPKQHKYPAFSVQFNEKISVYYG